MQDVLKNLEKKRGEENHHGPRWNAIDWLIKWMRPVDKKKAPPSAPTKDTPLRLSIVFAYGSSIIGQVDPSEVGDEVIVSEKVPPPEGHDVAKELAELFRGAGLVCELRLFKPRPPEPDVSKRRSAAPPAVRAKIVHILYIPG